jgi:hypothetical protein
MPKGVGYMRSNALTLILITAILSPACQAEAVKRWRDDAGKWHFGDSAAASGIGQVDTVDYQAHNIVVVKKLPGNIYKKPEQKSQSRKKPQKKRSAQ